MRRLCACWVVWVALAALAAAGSVSEAELEFLEALRRRELNRLLEIHCERLLARKELETEVRARYTIELAAILSQRAIGTAEASEREALWQKGACMVESFITQHPDSGQIPLLRYRWAAELIQRAEVLAKLAQVMPGDPAPGQQALESANQAVEMIRVATEEVERELNQPDRQKPRGADDLKRQELGSLSTALKFRRGAAWLAVARVEPDQAKRDAAAERAESVFKEYASEYNSAAIVLESHLALAELYRLTGKPRAAITILERMRRAETPKPFLARANLLLSRSLLDVGEVDAALKVLQGPKDARQSGAEWSLNLFEAMLRIGAKERATSPAQADKRQQEALAILDELEAQYGKYWSRRGEQILAKYGNLEAAGKDLALLRRLANVQRTLKEYAAAVKTYDQCAKLAEEKKEFGLAAEMAYAAASTIYQMADFPEAAGRFAALAARFSDHQLAPTAMLYAARAWARRYAKTRDRDSLASYRKVLEEHLRLFGENGPKVAHDPKTAPEVHWMLADLAERERRWEDALAHYRAVPATDQHFAESFAALASIYHDRFFGPERAKNAAAQDAKSAITFLERILAEPPTTLTDGPQGPAALATARFVLSQLLCLEAVGRSDEAVIMLREKVVRDQHLPAALKARAWQSLLDLLVRRRDANGAREVAATGFAGVESALLRCLAGFEPQKESLSAEERACQVAVIEAAAQQLLPQADKLQSRDRFNLNLLLAQAQAAKGDHRTAQRHFKRLRLEAPRDPRVIVSLAASQYDNRDYRDALDNWSLMRQGSPRGSPAWLLAIYQSIRCYAALGERDKAQKLLDTTIKLYPELGGPDLKAKFQALHQQLAGS